ncbi:MAG: hypothetical protein WBY53_18165 [Acidobacteriaceae bacterium]
MSKQTASLVAVLAIFLALALSAPLAAQQVVASASDPLTLPNAPTPQLSADQSSSSQNPSTDQQTTTPAPNPQAPETEEARHARAAAELKQEEKQRIAGVIPNFNTVNNGKAEAITPGQKFHLFFKGAFDPYQFALAGLDAGIGQAENSNPGYYQGLKGYGRRYGANYGDNFSGNFFGNAVLPSLLHQDPRYFRLGHGSIMHRAFYCISTTFRTYGDDGKWQPAYSNLTGNLIGASLSNLYYPDGDRGLYPTLRRALSITYQGTLGGLLQEFYPDIVQKYKTHRAREAAADSAAQGFTPIPPAPRPTPQP